ncbi:hypothetical protein INT43_005981 [Umbelopsis isabellina]|uniref:Glycerol uptake protein 1 n=1 Tax=Mortierella isabellina TaxID=91625 RepID=A0A8H7PK09_MORIS|nr:hypothetical protein INT43_005981 [Umbelopsis isabellina]
MSAPVSSGQPNSDSKSPSKWVLQPSRWRTNEFYFYYFAFAMVVPYMFKVTYDLSKGKVTKPFNLTCEIYILDLHNLGADIVAVLEDSPHYSDDENLIIHLQLIHKLMNNPILQDNSDNQYASFRDNIPTLVPLSLTYLALSHLYQRYCCCVTPIKHSNQSLSRTYFILGAAFLYIAVTNGTSIFKVLFITTVSYTIGMLTKGSWLNPALTWGFNLAVLFANEWNDGYRYSQLGESFAFLDNYKGITPRWHILFNFVMLRLVSFNMDYYWKHKQPREAYDKDERMGGPINDKDRIQKPCFAEDYNYINFLAYVLYTPLYLCGPIITFNDFVSQLRYPSTNVTRRYVTQYAVRLVFVVLTMELTLHYLYVVAISKSRAWAGDTPLQLSMIGYFNLVIIWMKLLIPWRFFRLWALADGFWVEENMVRCMSNNYSAQMFWKSWHRSFNRWTIRYIYVPLGGSKYFAFNMWVVFTFVALWHDIQLNLLAWGWLICLFLLPEIVATTVFSAKKWGSWPYYRHLCALGAVGNILMMMIANLVGFCVGLDGMMDLLSQIFTTVDGLIFLLCTIVCLFIAVQIMFEIRESEKRRGDPKWVM